MRTACLLVTALAVSAALAGCADDPRRPTLGLSSPSASPLPSPTPEPSPTAVTTAAAAATPSTLTRRLGARLTGDGIDLQTSLVAFGTPFEQARAALARRLGRPSQDTGAVASFGDYGTCPGTSLRALEYGGGALVVLFGDVDGPALTMYAWALTSDGAPGDVPQASALVGDAGLLAFGVGTTLAQLQQGAAAGTLTVSPGDELAGPSFRLQDEGPGFTGQLTGTAPTDTVTFVQGGKGCGE